MTTQEFTKIHELIHRRELLILELDMIQQLAELVSNHENKLTLTLKAEEKRPKIERPEYSESLEYLSFRNHVKSLQPRSEENESFTLEMEIKDTTFLRILQTLHEEKLSEVKPIQEKLNQLGVEV